MNHTEEVDDCIRGTLDITTISNCPTIFMPVLSHTVKYFDSSIKEMH